MFNIIIFLNPMYFILWILKTAFWEGSIASHEPLGILGMAMDFFWKVVFKIHKIKYMLEKSVLKELIWSDLDHFLSWCLAHVERLKGEAWKSSENKVSNRDATTCISCLKYEIMTSTAALSTEAWYRKRGAHY